MRVRRKGADEPVERDVDQLSDQADELAARAPDTPETATVARSAVEAAERLLRQDGGRPNQRRLARALWRQLSTLTEQATRAAQRMAVLHAALVARDPTCADDLAGTR